MKVGLLAITRLGLFSISLVTDSFLHISPGRNRDLQAMRTLLCSSSSSEVVTQFSSHFKPHLKIYVHRSPILSTPIWVWKHETNSSCHDVSF